jgi:hypothetical protein
MMLVAYMPQMKRGRRRQCMPGARSLWIVTMKLSPVRIDENPRMNTARVIDTTDELEECCTGCRRSSPCRPRRSRC